MLTPGGAGFLEDPVRVLFEPALELADRDQPAPATADDAQLMHDVLLEEVDTDAQGVSRLTLREGETTDRGVCTSCALVIDCLAEDAHAQPWRESGNRPPQATTSPKMSRPSWDWDGTIGTPIRRFPAASTGSKTESPATQPGGWKWLRCWEITVLSGGGGIRTLGGP